MLHHVLRQTGRADRASAVRALLPAFGFADLTVRGGRPASGAVRASSLPSNQPIRGQVSLSR